MLRCPIQADTAAWLPLMVLASCGDASVPQSAFDAARPDAVPVVDAVPMVIDAAPPANACPCCAEGMSSRIGSIPYSTEIFDGHGVGTSCDPQYSGGQFSGTAELLGGSCVLEDGRTSTRRGCIAPAHTG